MPAPKVKHIATSRRLFPRYLLIVLPPMTKKSMPFPKKQKRHQTALIPPLAVHPRYLLIAVCYLLIVLPLLLATCYLLHLYFSEKNSKVPQLL